MRNFAIQTINHAGGKLLAAKLVIPQTTSAVDLSTFANLINAIAVTAGVIFAGVQIRHYRQRRRRDDMRIGAAGCRCT